MTSLSSGKLFHLHGKSANDCSTDSNNFSETFEKPTTCTFRFPSVSLWYREPLPLKPQETTSTGFWPFICRIFTFLSFTRLTDVWWVFLRACLCDGGAHTCMCTWRPEVHLTCPSTGPFFLWDSICPWPGIYKLDLFWLTTGRVTGARICCAFALSVRTPTPSLGMRHGGRECLLYATWRFSAQQRGLPLSSFTVHGLAFPSRTFSVC